MNFWERGSNNTQNGYGNGNNTQYGNGKFESGGQNVNGGAYNAQSAGYSEQDVRQKFEQYSNKSEDQLMSELTSMAARMKREGSFDINAIENLYNTAQPFLNDEQKQRMRQIIDMLKG